MSFEISGSRQEYRRLLYPNESPLPGLQNKKKFSPGRLCFTEIRQFEVEEKRTLLMEQPNIFSIVQGGATKTYGV